MKKIAVVGGEKDFNLIRLITLLSERGLAIKVILFGDNSSHKFHYDLKKNHLLLNNQFFDVNALFMRTDVFQYLDTKNPYDNELARTWKQVFSAWALANPEVKVFNRSLLSAPFFQKIYVLDLAHRLGISIPDTYLSNSVKDLNLLTDKEKMIRKPVSGGDYTKELSKFDETIYKEQVTRAPMICQSLLDYPELRVFKIGKDFFSFEINSTALDYRENNETNSMRLIENDLNLVTKLDELNQRLGLDFSAADLKFSKKTSSFNLLEINTSPMFAGFDRVANGRLIEAMINFLSGT